MNKPWPTHIKLTRDLPIAKKHGAVAGAVFPVVDASEVGEIHGALCYFRAKDGTKCGAYRIEYEFCQPEKDNPAQAEKVKQYDPKRNHPLRTSRQLE